MFVDKQAYEPIKILIVDDEQTNIILLGELLGNNGYEIIVALSGLEALELVQSNHIPDLILLDIMMPEMDGFEVCRILKDNPETSQIPIIFITAMDAKDEVIKGLQMGAIDYITKPYSPIIVKTKVRNIAEFIATLHRLEDRVNLELIQNERMTSLGQLVAGFTHDLSTPLSVAAGSTAFTHNSSQNLRTLLQQDEISEEEVFEQLDKLKESTQLISSHLQRANEMVGSFKRVSIDQTSEAPRSFQLKQLIDDTVLSLYHQFKRTQISVTIDCDEKITLYGIPGKLGQVLTNLLNNSWQHAFNKGSEAGNISIKIELQEDSVIINYRDDGHGMNEVIRNRVFERFYTTAREDGGSGVGMHNAYQLITQQMHGSIECQSEPEKGVHFQLKLLTEQN